MELLQKIMKNTFISIAAIIIYVSACIHNYINWHSNKATLLKAKVRLDYDLKSPIR